MVGFPTFQDQGEIRKNFQNSKNPSESIFMATFSKIAIVAIVNRGFHSAMRGHQGYAQHGQVLHQGGYNVQFYHQVSHQHGLHWGGGVTDGICQNDKTGKSAATK